MENNKNFYRYNITGFVEELPQLPDIRRGHACGAFPTNKVRSKEPNLNYSLYYIHRHLLLLVEIMDLRTLPPCLRFFPGLQSGPLLHPFLDLYTVPELCLSEEG